MRKNSKVKLQQSLRCCREKMLSLKWRFELCASGRTSNLSISIAASEEYLNLGLFLHTQRVKRMPILVIIIDIVAHSTCSFRIFFHLSRSRTSGSGKETSNKK